MELTIPLFIEEIRYDKNKIFLHKVWTSVIKHFILAWCAELLASLWTPNNNPQAEVFRLLSDI